MNRGDICWYSFPDVGRRPSVIVTRGHYVRFLTRVTVATISTNERGVATEVSLGAENGLPFDSVANCLALHTVHKADLEPVVGTLNPEQLFQLDVALEIALGLDEAA